MAFFEGKEINKQSKQREICTYHVRQRITRFCGARIAAVGCGIGGGGSGGSSRGSGGSHGIL